MSQAKKPMTYRASGVDIDTGNALVDRIKPIVKETFRPGVLSGIGGFGGLFELPWSDYQNPILVSGTDGVGTKLKLAIDLGIHDTIGIDLVAMCVNDIIVTGAEPLFFLDYFATGKLELDTAEAVIAGIAEGCKQSGCALIGGETAEMPGMYDEGDYDLAGFSVGLVEKARLVDTSQVQAGDIILGLASSGPHSNGYSLVRKVIEVSGEALTTPFDNTTLGAALLAPTRIYVTSLLALLEKVAVHSLAHITGGGLTENLPRVLPDNTAAHIQLDSWQRPAAFDWLQTQGNIETSEMLRTFNCGVGMTICLSPDEADLAIKILTDAGETVSQIGEIKSAEGEPQVVFE